MSKGPQFVSLKDFIGKEDRAKPSSKQLHKKKQKWYRSPNEPIKRRRNLFDALPRMRTTRHVRDRPDLSPPPLDETHSPLRHPSSRGTQIGLPSSGDNHRTSSPTRQRQPLPPPVDRRQHSKRSKGSTSTAIPNQLLDQMRIILRDEVQSAMRSEFENLRTKLFAFLSIPRHFRREDCAEHVLDPYSPSDPFENELKLIWCKFQPDFHAPMPKTFYPTRFDFPLDLIVYAISEESAWETAWASVDDYREEQILPLRRLFRLICNKSSYYDVSKRNLACMKAMRLAPCQFPCQVDGSSCGAFMLKGMEYVMMGKEPNFNFVQQDIPSFRKQFTRDIFANSLEP
ncbi:hypothetical protein LWI28_019315 [Acer negundo]|uniref:Ubiquitin-like protease family profile domain-containing protein n=1 Tax=Acer negundo TaxID=4023 RepID=A0AAD5IIT2_ACENE|nr:hypothetical protein LWI28_019315 [Acer negundo]